MDLRLAIERARLHLEWVEIALALTQWRFEESTRRIEPKPHHLGLAEKHILSVLVVQPHAPEAPDQHAPADAAVDVTNEAP